MKELYHKKKQAVFCFSQVGKIVFYCNTSLYICIRVLVSGFEKVARIDGIYITDYEGMIMNNGLNVYSRLRESVKSPLGRDIFLMINILGT